MKFRRPPPGTLLYKYYPPKNAGLVLSNRKIRFSPLIEFNDPFELNTYPVNNFTEFEFGHALSNEIYDAILSGEELKGTGPFVKLVKAFIQGKIKDISAYDFAIDLGVLMAKKKFVPEPSSDTRLVQLRLAKIIGSFCASETFDNLLMWAHYASNHEGFALGIDPSQAGEIFDAMAPVIYQETYPKMDDPFVAASVYLGRAKTIDGAGLRAVERMFFTKSKDWSYEREWRAIRDSKCDPTADHKSFDIEAQLVEIPPIAFSSLYVGCRSSPEIVKDYVTMARAINPRIEIFKTRPSTKAFSLEFQSYDEPWPMNYPPKDQVI